MDSICMCLVEKWKIMWKLSFNILGLLLVSLQPFPCTVQKSWATLFSLYVASGEPDCFVTFESGLVLLEHVSFFGCLFLFSLRNVHTLFLGPLNTDQRIIQA